MSDTPCTCGWPDKACLRRVLSNGPPFPTEPCEPSPGAWPEPEVFEEIALRVSRVHALFVDEAKADDIDDRIGLRQRRGEEEQNLGRFVCENVRVLFGIKRDNRAHVAAVTADAITKEIKAERDGAIADCTTAEGNAKVALDRALLAEERLAAATSLIGRASPFVNACAVLAEDKAPSLGWLADAATWADTA